MSTLYISFIIVIIIIITKIRTYGEVGTHCHMIIVALSCYVSCIDHFIVIKSNWAVHLPPEL